MSSRTLFGSPRGPTMVLESSTKVLVKVFFKWKNDENCNYSPSKLKRRLLQKILHSPKPLFGGGVIKKLSESTTWGPESSENILGWNCPTSTSYMYTRIPKTLNLVEKTTKTLFLWTILHPRKHTFLGWGGRNFFGPHQMGSRKLEKNFSWWSPHFRTLYGYKTQKVVILAENRPKIENFENRFRTNFGLWVSGAPQIFFLS